MGLPRSVPRKVEDVRIDDAPSLDTLIRRLDSGGGFSAKEVATGVDLLARILKDREMTTFLSFPADIVATGTRGVLATLVREGYVDAVITTCGTLDHDLARSYRPYYHGDWDLDDADLHRRHVYRLGNLIIPRANYGTILERKMRVILDRLWAGGTRALSTRALAAAIGEAIPSRERSSILRAAADRNVPVIVPGITDGAVGSQVWLYWQDHRGLSIDLLSDEQLLSDLVFDAKRSGAIMLGGGISKHHTIWEPVPGRARRRALPHDGGGVGRQPIGGPDARGGLVGEGEGERSPRDGDGRRHRPLPADGRGGARADPLRALTSPTRTVP